MNANSPSDYELQSAEWLAEQTQRVMQRRAKEAELIVLPNIFENRRVPMKKLYQVSRVKNNGLPQWLSIITDDSEDDKTGKNRKLPKWLSLFDNEFNTENSEHKELPGWVNLLVEEPNYPSVEEKLWSQLKENAKNIGKTLTATTLASVAVSQTPPFTPKSPVEDSTTIPKVNSESVLHDEPPPHRSRRHRLNKAQRAAAKKASKNRPGINDGENKSLSSKTKMNRGASDKSKSENLVKGIGSTVAKTKTNAVGPDVSSPVVSSMANLTVISGGPNASDSNVNKMGSGDFTSEDNADYFNTDLDPPKIRPRGVNEPISTVTQNVFELTSTRQMHGGYLENVTSKLVGAFLAQQGYSAFGGIPGPVVYGAPEYFNAAGNGASEILNIVEEEVSKHYFGLNELTNTISNMTVGGIDHLNEFTNGTMNLLRNSAEVPDPSNFGKLNDVINNGSIAILNELPKSVQKIVLSVANNIPNRSDVLDLFPADYQDAASRIITPFTDYAPAIAGSALMVFVLYMVRKALLRKLAKQINLNENVDVKDLEMVQKATGNYIQNIQNIPKIFFYKVVPKMSDEMLQQPRLFERNFFQKGGVVGNNPILLRDATNQFQRQQPGKTVLNLGGPLDQRAEIIFTTLEDILMQNTYWKSGILGDRFENYSEFLRIAKEEGLKSSPAELYDMFFTKDYRSGSKLQYISHLLSETVESVTEIVPETIKDVLGNISGQMTEIGQSTIGILPGSVKDVVETFANQMQNGGFGALMSVQKEILTEAIGPLATDFLILLASESAKRLAYKLLVGGTLKLFQKKSPDSKSAPVSIPVTDFNDASDNASESAPVGDDNSSDDDSSSDEDFM